MTQDSWGWLEPFEKFGRLCDFKDSYLPIEYNDARQNSKNSHASHGMIFARDDRVLWDLYKARGAVLMQMRFDGVLGFPGGLVEKGEDPLDGLNREMEEEINLDLKKHKFTNENHVASWLNEKNSLILHFYLKEVTLGEFKSIELSNLQAKDYGIETFGIVRPPLFTMGDSLRGLPAFLGNHFAGNAREELLIGLQKSGLLGVDELQTALKSCQAFQKEVYTQSIQNAGK